jgi:hypothetical protein
MPWSLRCCVMVVVPLAGVWFLLSVFVSCGGMGDAALQQAAILVITLAHDFSIREHNLAENFLIGA